MIEKIRNKHNAQRSRVMGKIKIFQLERRVKELEKLLSESQQKNQDLQDEINFLHAQLDDFKRKWGPDRDER